MESVQVLLLLFVGVLGIALVGSRRRRSAEEAGRAEALELVTAVAEQDVALFWDRLAELGRAIEVHPLNTAAHQDHQRALESHDYARRLVAVLRHPEHVRTVTEALEDGGYSVACVRARMAGEPVPTRRPPCFFNPQHGPSTDDAVWAPVAGRRPSPVPVCAADAGRVRAGTAPATRQVPVGSQSRPYWEAGPVYAPYANGYFGAHVRSGQLPRGLAGSLPVGWLGPPVSSGGEYGHCGGNGGDGDSGGGCGGD